MCLPLLDQSAREALPSGRQRAGELLGEVVYGRGPRDVEVGREARNPVAQAHLDGATPLTESSGSIWATIVFAMIARLAMRFGFPMSLSSATSRLLLLFGRFTDIRALQFLLQ